MDFLNLMNEMLPPTPPVRSYDVYREDVGPTAVSSARAADITDGVKALMEPALHAPVAFNHVAGAEFETDEDPVALSTLVLPGDAAHTVLLTGRKVLARDGTSREGGDFEVVTNRLSVPVRTTSRIVVAPAAQDPENLRSVANGVHTLAHTLGVGHCATSGCIMWESPQATASYIAEVAATGRPFCSEHAGQLAVVGTAGRAVNAFTNLFRL